MNRDRAMIFIDHANVYMNLRNLNCLIDYVKFKDVLTQYSHLAGAFIFMGLPEKIPKDLQKFITYIEKAGFVIQPKPILITPNGKKKQKGIDVFMYKEIVELAEADAYDKAIIVSGDVADGDPYWRTNQGFQDGYCVAGSECPYSCFLIDYLCSITIE